MQNHIISREKLISQLKGVINTLPANAPIIFHTDLLRTGAIDSMKSAAKLLEDYESVLDEVCATRPYLIPTFNYDYCKTLVYDVNHDPSQVGALGRHYLTRYPDCRTHTPVFNFVVRNDPKKLFTMQAQANPFGSGSTWDVHRRLGGYIFFLGTDLFSNTFDHHVEEMVPVRYRYIKSFKGKIIFNGTIQNFDFQFRVRPMPGGCIYDLPKTTSTYINIGIAKSADCGLSKMYWYNAQDYFQYGFDKITKEDEFWFLTREAAQKMQEHYQTYGCPLTFEKCEPK